MTHLLASRYWADPSVRKGGPAQEFFDVAGPGNFNDPDELYVGDGSLTPEEEQAVMALIEAERQNRRAFHGMHSFPFYCFAA